MFFPQPRKDQDVNTDRVALIVDEPIPGHYYWILQRQDGAACRAVAAAEVGRAVDGGHVVAA